MVAPASNTVGRVNGTHFSPRTISYIDDNKREEYLWQSLTVTRLKLLRGCPRPVRPRRTSARIIRDLYLLRDAAVDERGAIADYHLRAETCLDEIFLDVAEDEMEHYAETMRLISWLDPVQAEMFRRRSSRRVGNETADRQAKWATAKKPGSGGCRGPPARFARRSMHHQGHTR